MLVLSFDLGRHLGFALLGPGVVRSGSREILKTWQPFGAAIIILENRLQALIDQHKPDVLGTARPFVRRGRLGSMVDTPQNLVPMFGAFTILHRVAEINMLPLEIIQESDARSAMLGKGNMPRGSDALKKAIIQSCRDRGWPACNDHAGDALCIAAAVMEKIRPGYAHETTPLFATAPRARRKKAA